VDINSYGSLIKQVVPGTFVPDIAPGAGTPSATPAVAPVAGGTFKDAVKSFLGGVNEKMATSDQLSTALAAGKTHRSKRRTLHSSSRSPSATNCSLHIPRFNRCRSSRQLGTGLKSDARSPIKESGCGWTTSRTEAGPHVKPD